MAGLLDDLSGAFGGSYSGDDTVKDQYGQTQAERRQPLWSGLIKAGLLGVAAGGNLMPAERAKYIAEAGGALGDIQPQMQAQQSQAMQNLLRQQQMKLTGVEMQGKQADLAQQAQWRAYAQSPEFQKAMDSANATPAERMAAQAAAMKGDFATVAKVLDPKRNQPKVNADGTITMPDGSIVNAFGQVIIGRDGKPVSPSATPTATPTQPTVDPDVNSPDINKRIAASDREIAQWSTPQQPPPAQQAALFAPSKFTNIDMNALKDIADKYGPQVAQQVRDFAEYKTPFPISTRTAAIVNPNSTTAQMASMVKRVNPDWTSADFANRNKMVNEYLISGKAKNNIDALNTAYGHIGDLYDTFQALNTPSNNQLVNKAILRAREISGDPTISDAQTAARAVAHELSSVFRAQGMSVAEIEDWGKGIGLDMSNAQKQAVIERAVHLMQSRVDTHMKDWNNVMGKTPVQFFNPERIQKVQQIHENPIGGVKPTAATPTATPTQAEIAAEIARRKQQQQGQ